MKQEKIPLSEKGKQYRLLEQVGAGAYGAVYRALDEEGMTVAVKFPLISGKDEVSRFSARVQREAYFLQKAASEHFVSYIDHRQGRKPYLVMEYVSETLADLAARNEISQEVIMDYILQIPRILMKLKEAKIAHCDLKGSNFGYVNRKIITLDLGLAIPFEGTVFSPFRKPEEGEESYPPEFSRRIILPQSDTYSAGRALEFMLTGQYGQDLQETYSNIELIHDLDYLPETIKAFLAGMLNRHFLARKSPERLEELAQSAAAVLRKRNLFHPLKFATVRISEEGLLVTA